MNEDSLWNQTLAEGIASAFCAAIERFNRKEGSANQLRYTWPLFLAVDTASLSPFWRKIPNSVDTALSASEILVSQSPPFLCRQPSMLMFMDWAHNSDLKPLFGRLQDFVSTSYPPTVRKHLARLGVKTPNAYWLSQQLSQLHEDGCLHDDFHDRFWHEDLAKAILNSMQNQMHDLTVSEVRWALTEIPIIPMLDGSWRCPPMPNSDTVYFPTIHDISVPNDVEIPMVNPEATDSSSRKELFRILGVIDCKEQNVVNHIIRLHRKLNRNQPVSATSLADHIRYLFEVWENIVGDFDTNRLKRDIWFAVAGSEIRRGDEVYVIDSLDLEIVPEKYRLRSVFANYPGAHYLDQSYANRIVEDEQQEFADWLMTIFGMENIPRLCLGKKLHPDFKWLLQNRNDHVLGILETHWRFYDDVITKDAASKIGKLNVLCRSLENQEYEEYMKLESTFAPSDELVEECESITGNANCTFLVLPDTQKSDVSKWNFLMKFGVGFNKSLNFYLWILSQKGFRDCQSEDVAKRLYSKIQSCAREDDDRYSTIE